MLQYTFREDTDDLILYGQYHSHWCPGDAISQGINTHGIDLVPPAKSTSAPKGHVSKHAARVDKIITVIVLVVVVVVVTTAAALVMVIVTLPVCNMYVSVTGDAWVVKYELVLILFVYSCPWYQITCIQNSLSWVNPKKALSRNGLRMDSS